MKHINHCSNKPIEGSDLFAYFNPGGNFFQPGSIHHINIFFHVKNIFLKVRAGLLQHNFLNFNSWYYINTLVELFFMIKSLQLSSKQLQIEAKAWLKKKKNFRLSSKTISQNI